jgi:hypothetical protein
MLKFIKDSHGVMDLSLSQVGLFIATGILLAAICSVVFYNNWQRTDELHSIATSISTRIQDMDTMFFENTTMYQCPYKNYHYMIEASTEYITTSAKGYWGNSISMKERMIVHPWPRNASSNWTTGHELHDFLNTTYGHWGTQEDPLLLENFTDLESDWEKSVLILALHPLELQVNAPLCIEKVSIFDDAGGRHDFILMYQAPLFSRVILF